MKNARQRLKAFQYLRNTVFVLTGLLLIVYMMTEPYPTSSGNALSLQYIALLACVFISVALALWYEIVCGKAVRILEDMMLMVEDAGWYYTARHEPDAFSYCNAVKEDLLSHGFKLRAADGFAFCAVKGNEYFYALIRPSLDKETLLSLQEKTLQHLCGLKLHPKGDALLMVLTSHTEESAVNASKYIRRSAFGRKGSFVLQTAIIEPHTKRVYCLGNRVSRAQKMIVNYVMNCDLPPDSRFICNDKLPFQKALSQTVNTVTIKELRDYRETL